MPVLTETNLANVGTRRKGKVRDIYEQPKRLLLVSTDRHSSFDRNIAHVPFKGQVLNQTSLWWFEETKDIVPNHVIASPDPNVTVGRRCTPVPVEAVMRGFNTGVTDTSIWTRYCNGQREFGGIILPEGMKKNTKLLEPIFDPTTKEEGHDRAITLAQMIDEGFITQELFDKIRDTATRLFKRGQEIAAARGLILVDTKYEFGLDEDGNLVLIDEIHTPDSSRWWKLDSYQARMDAGEEPEFFDKEFLRKWFIANCKPYEDATLPEAPAEMVAELSRRYIAIYEQITGNKFMPGEEPILPRIERNLAAYAI